MREVLVGWIIWDETEQTPYRPTLGQDWRTRKAPARIYKTEKMAISLGGVAKPVYVKLPDLTLSEMENYNVICGL